jgi:uncharacterized coiled-coil protein SlyX
MIDIQDLETRLKMQDIRIDEQSDAIARLERSVNKSKFKLSSAAKMRRTLLAKR